MFVFILCVRTELLLHTQTYATFIKVHVYYRYCGNKRKRTCYVEAEINKVRAVYLRVRVLLKWKCRINVSSTFNDVHGQNKHNTPDVFSAIINRFLFTYYSLTVSVENVLVKHERAHAAHHTRAVAAIDRIAN